MNTIIRTRLTLTSMLMLLYLSISNLAYSQETHNNETKVFVSIPPLLYFVNTISNNTVNAISLVPDNISAELYRPTAKQLFTLSKAQLFIGIGLSYEKDLPRAGLSKQDLHIVTIGKAITRLALDGHEHDSHDDDHIDEHDSHDDDHMDEHDSHDDDHTDEHDSHDDDHTDEHDSHDDDIEAGDPHIWLSVDNATILAEETYTILVQTFPNKKAIFDRGYAELMAQIKITSQQVSELLLPYKNRAIMIYHPALGYLSDEFGIKQLSIQWKGQERSLKQIKQIVVEAKAQKVKTIFIQEGFPDSAARNIAKSIDGRVVKINPLHANWNSNMLFIARNIAQSFN